MTLEQIQKDIKQKKFSAIYFLHGEESYFIDLIANQLEASVLSEDEKSFNQTILYGKETDFKTVVDHCRRFPMMAPYNLVILKEAQAMRDLDKLEAYFASPSASTVLVVCHKHKNADARKKFVKTVKKTGLVFQSKPLYDNQVPAWIQKFVKKSGYKIDAELSLLIANYLGTDLGKISNELKKLFINLKKGSDITQEDVDEYIGISKDYNIFEFQDAIALKNKEKAYNIAAYFCANPKKHPMVMVSATLYNFFSKLYILHGLPRVTDREVQTALSLPFPGLIQKFKQAKGSYNMQQTEKAFGILSELDLQSKGVGAVSTTYEDQMMDLTYRLLAA